MSKIFALVDCNNFYASCERVFKPALQGRAVVVLSNNDGCIVARSNEAKALGIKMGEPFFKAKDMIEKNSVAVFSSNYTLYADMSSRVMQTLSGFTTNMEIYSIDEAFLSLDGFGDKLDEYGREIRHRVLRWTGLPVSVGIAKTKTLAKIANHLAKKSAKAKGVLYLDRQRYIDAALEATPVEDVWGVGSRISKKLKQAGIYNARQLSQANLGWIKKRFSVMLVRTVLELRGKKCFELEEAPAANQNITVSRSFGKEVESLQQLRQAVCMYVCRAGEKLRSQNLCAKVVTVFAMNNRFGDRVYYNSASHIFETASESSLDLVQAAAKLTKQVYRKSVRFKKAGVILSKLTPKDQIQLNLFTDWGKFARDKRLMEVLDKINCLEKRVYFAGEGLEKPWQTKFERKSDCYTTRWDELIEVW